MKTTICGIPYKIIYRERNLRDDDNMGKSDIMDGAITILKDMPKEVQEVTLIHEWIHVVYSSNSLDHTEQHASVMANELYRNGFRVKVEK